MFWEGTGLDALTMVALWLELGSSLSSLELDSECASRRRGLGIE